jgi:hypothetical protein
MELPTAVKKKMEEAKAGMETSQQKPSTPQIEHQDRQPEAATQVPPAPAATVATRLQPKATLDVSDWEHKYKVLQGMHKKETAELRERIAEIETKLSQASVPTLSGKINFADYGITPEQVDEYGAEYWETQIRIQQSLVTQVTGSSAQNGEFDQLKRQVEEQARSQFYQRLDQLVPDWREVDQSAEWDAFLGQTDSATGLTNEDLLSDAFGHNDSDRVAALFSRFKTTGSGSHRDLAQNVAPETKQAPSLQVNSSQGKMTMDQWVKEVNALPSKGLTPVQMVNEHNRLKAMLRDGKVTGGPGQEPDPGASVGFV